MATTAPIARFLPLLLTALLPFCAGQVLAQTPARNLMPDGSSDMYLGLGLIQQARYEGASRAHTRPVALLQFQTSNGLFVAGNQLGWHLSAAAQHEYGPLLMYQEKRSQSGSNTSIISGNGSDSFPNPLTPHTVTVGKLDEVPARLLLGGFYHYHPGGNWRLTSNFLYGAGANRNGARFTPEVQYSLPFPHATLSLQAGLVWANQAWNQSYFGVAPGTVSGLPLYAAHGGVKDVHLGLNWNWALSSSWLLTSSVKLTHLQGSAADSPLVQRRTSATFSSALAWRF